MVLRAEASWALRGSLTNGTRNTRPEITPPGNPHTYSSTTASSESKTQPVVSFMLERRMSQVLLELATQVIHQNYY